ncbi:MAG: hypothetical protein IT166_24075 [Bryobacterales bacterium]|nr:hypothetical protein [Bryobacterales bacterium]
MRKTAAVTAVVVVSNVAGNLFLSFGMKSPAGILSPWIAAGVLLLVLWTLTRMALLSWADLSFVLPVTAIGYPLSAIAGKLFLAEQITPQRWAGTVLIVAGTVLVGLTMPAARKERP